MIGVVTAMGGQVERYRQTGLPGREVLAVKGIGFLGC